MKTDLKVISCVTYSIWKSLCNFKHLWWEKIRKYSLWVWYFFSIFDALFPNFPNIKHVVIGSKFTMQYFFFFYKENQNKIYVVVLSFEWRNFYKKKKKWWKIEKVFDFVVIENMVNEKKIQKKLFSHDDDYCVTFRWIIKK